MTLPITMGWNLDMLLLLATLFLHSLATRLEWNLPSTATAILQEDAETTEEALARASKLRDGSSADWQAKRYRNAVEKLAEADSIYARLEGRYESERAICMRAICWNLVRTEDLDGAFSTFEDLCRFLPPGAAEHEVRSAYVALHEMAAASVPTVRNRLLDDCRDLFEDTERDLFAAQVLHDLGSFHSKDGHWKEMSSYFERAVAIREELNDATGAAWSWNNLALGMLTAGRIEQALKPLAAAHDAILSGTSGPESAVAINLRRAIDAILQADTPPRRETTDWLWQRAEKADAAARPEHIATGRLWLAALRADVRRTGIERSSKAFRRLAKAPLKNQPPAVRCDLLLRAGELLVEAREGKRALAWSKKISLEEVDGPAAQHLRARHLTLEARALAQTEKAGPFLERAVEAAAAYRELNRKDRETALGSFVEAAAPSVKAEEEFQQIASEYQTLKRQAWPGGLGGNGSARSPSDRIGELGPSDPVFRVSFVDGRIEVRDLLSDVSVNPELRWREANYGFNGLSLGFLGGYVTLRAMNYGGTSGAGGGRSGIGWRDLEDSKPIPESGAWYVTRSGGWTFAADEL